MGNACACAVCRCVRLKLCPTCRRDQRCDECPGGQASFDPRGRLRDRRACRYDKKSLDATETLTYRNLTGQPLASFPFHLYLNAFQPDSTFTSETHFTGGIRDAEAADAYPPQKLGSIKIAQLEVDGFGDLTRQLHFIAPDDHNANDRTVALLELPGQWHRASRSPFISGSTISFRSRWHATGTSVIF